MAQVRGILEATGAIDANTHSTLGGRELGALVKNPYVRIAVIIVAVILLYYLVIALGRGAAAASDRPAPAGGPEQMENPGERRTLQPPDRGRTSPAASMPNWMDVNWMDV